MRLTQKQPFGDIPVELPAYRSLQGWVEHGDPGTVTAANATATPTTALLQAIFSDLPAGILLLDDAETIKECNPAAETLLGNELRGAHWPTIAARHFTFGCAESAELALCGERLLNIIAAPASAAGRILMLVDVTENQALQKRFYEQHRVAALSDMAAELAHKIRTPLAMSILYVSHLARASLGARERRDYADKVGSGLQYIEQLVEDILLTAADPAHLQHEDEEVTVSSLLSDCAGLLQAEIETGGCELALIDHAPNAVVRGSRSALTRALANIVRNAVQACGTGGRLRLVVRPAGNEAVALQVQDDGPGIAHELQQWIFEPFVSTRTESMGLGLAVARAIVRGHRGVLWFESQPGAGASFVIQLPANLPSGACVVDLSEARERARRNKNH